MRLLQFGEFRLPLVNELLGLQLTGGRILRTVILQELDDIGVSSGNNILYLRPMRLDPAGYRVESFVPSVNNLFLPALTGILIFLVILLQPFRKCVTSWK